MKNILRRLHSVPLSMFTMCMACAEANPPDDYIDIVFDPCEPIVVTLQDATHTQRASVQEALDLWNELLGSQLTLSENIDAPRIPIEFDRAAKAFRGYYDDEIGIVYINDRLVGREITITTAHELGHTFGLFHVDAAERPSVMNHGNMEVVPNEADARDVAAIWGECVPVGE